MSSGKQSEFWVGLVVGIVVSVIGALANGWMIHVNQQDQQRAKFIADSFTFDISRVPVQFQSINILMKQTENDSLLSANSIRKLAKLSKKCPDCSTNLEPRCFPAYVQTIQVIREEAGIGGVSDADLTEILKPFYFSAIDAEKYLDAK